MQPVFRIEAEGEAATPFPTLAAAMQLSPSSRESYIATSEGGIHLADPEPIGGAGGVLQWSLTHVGRDVRDREGWQHVPNASETDAVLEVALREDFEAIAS